MKNYKRLSKAVLAVCLCGVILAMINAFTGIINSSVKTSGTVICIAGFVTAGIVTIILENEKKKKPEPKNFDRSEFYPVIHSSICTGEKVAGFKRKDNGQFIEIMLLQNQEDMETFLNTYGISREEVKTEY